MPGLGRDDVIKLPGDGVGYRVVIVGIGEHVVVAEAVKLAASCQEVVEGRDEVDANAVLQHKARGGGSEGRARGWGAWWGRALLAGRENRQRGEEGYA